MCELVLCPLNWVGFGVIGVEPDGVTLASFPFFLDTSTCYAASTCESPGERLKKYPLVYPPSYILRLLFFSLYAVLNALLDWKSWEGLTLCVGWRG